MKRKPDESQMDYQIRLCRDKELYGLSWQGVADLLNEEYGDEYSKDKYKKFWYNFKQGVEYERAHRLDDDQLAQEYESRRVEMEKERVRLQDQRREYNNLIRKQARTEHLHERIIESIGTLEPLQWTQPVSRYDTHRESVIVLSDWHKGLFASNYWNEFNDAEFERRVKRIVDKSIVYAHANDTRILHVFLGGDMVHGLIHLTTRLLATENVLQQTTSVAEMLSDVVARYASEFDEVKVYHIIGNHGRMMPDKSDSVSDENFDHIVTWYMRARLEHIRNVEFVDNTYDAEIIDAKVAGWTVYAVHGDKDKAANVVQNLALMTGHKPDYIITAHVHKDFRDEVHRVKIITNSSLSGVDAYAKDIRRTSIPAQKLIVFDEYEGEVCTYPIRCDIA